MKTKLTLLLALAVSAAAHAEKPGFNGVKPAANIPSPAPRSVPPRSGSGGSSSALNAGQIISIARSALPLLMNATQPPPPRPAAAKSRASVPQGRAANAKPKTAVEKPLPSPALTSSAAMREGRDIANGLQSLDSLRDAAVSNADADLGTPFGPDQSHANDDKMRRQFENSLLAAFHPGSQPTDAWNPGSILPNGGRNQRTDHFSKSGGSSLAMPSFGSIRSGLASDGPATGRPGDHREHQEVSGERTTSTSRETHADGTVGTKTVVVTREGTREIFHEERADKDGDGEAETIIYRRSEFQRADGSGASQETTRNADGTYTTTERSILPGRYHDERRGTTSSMPEAMPLPHIRTGCVDPDATPRGGQKFTSLGHKGEDPAIMRARNRPGNQVRPDENSNTPASTPRIVSQGPGTVVNPGPVDMTRGTGGSAMTGARLLDGGKLVNPGRDARGSVKP
jgi:hypothetical protein